MKQTLVSVSVVVSDGLVLRWEVDSTESIRTDGGAQFPDSMGPSPVSSSYYPGKKPFLPL